MTLNVHGAYISSQGGAALQYHGRCASNLPTEPENARWEVKVSRDRRVLIELSGPLVNVATDGAILREVVRNMVEAAIEEWLTQQDSD